MTPITASTKVQAPIKDYLDFRVHRDTQAIFRLVQAVRLTPDSVRAVLLAPAISHPAPVAQPIRITASVKSSRDSFRFGQSVRIKDFPQSRDILFLRPIRPPAQFGRLFLPEPRRLAKR